MQDLVQRIDRLKEILADARARPAETMSPEQTAEIGAIGLDLLGEIIANGRRIATAMEQLAASMQLISSGDATILTRVN